MRRTALAALLVVLTAAPALAQCEITGNVPQQLRDPICGIATSAHGGDAPVNQLTLTVSVSVATAVRLETPPVAEDALLDLLAAWKRLRGVRVARLEVFYGRAHLATARTHVIRPDSVEFH